jgi:hypothetical protein
MGRRFPYRGLVIRSLEASRSRQSRSSLRRPRAGRLARALGMGDQRSRWWASIYAALPPHPGASATLAAKPRDRRAASRYRCGAVRRPGSPGPRAAPLARRTVRKAKTAVFGVPRAVARNMVLFSKRSQHRDAAVAGSDAGRSEPESCRAAAAFCIAVISCCVDGMIWSLGQLMHWARNAIDGRQ